VRPLRPLFHRSAAKDELERQAERLRNRDWIEILRVIHPTQAAKAEQEYLLARLRADWAEIVNPLLAQHSQPADFNSGILLVHCDHNSFANELMLVASVVEKKIAARYGYQVKLRAKATRRLSWHVPDTTASKSAASAVAKAKATNPIIEAIIAQLSNLETGK
jgi:hypothetical protein